jgi:NADPH-dependent 2,4-dienoyl-CoA reductase/sulfur reductase-like enzyme
MSWSKRKASTYFAADDTTPPPSRPGEEMRRWRRELLRLLAVPPETPRYDVVVVGGGIAGCTAALTAARQELHVALVQNRPVLGGNASSEIGITPRGSNSSLVDQVAGPEREQVIRREPLIDLYLGWHAFAAAVHDGRITSVDATNTRTSEELRFVAPIFKVPAGGSAAIFRRTTCATPIPWGRTEIAAATNG